jgi:2-phospho-L-lactate guanylyltransferase
MSGVDSSPARAAGPASSHAQTLVWAVVVARVGPRAKSRLAVALEVDQRRQLALAMLADVLDVCTSISAPLSGVVAVVDDPVARGLAERNGAVVVTDGGGDMNAAVSLGLCAALARGAQTAIVLPADIPLLSTSDLRVLLETAADAPRSVVIGASRDGQGTNALLLRPPDVIRPAFGPPSVERHAQLGQHAAAATTIISNLGLALDVDTPQDLAALADLAVGPHTAAALANGVAFSNAALSPI